MENKMNKNLPKQQTLPKTILRDGVSYQLDETTETYHLITEELELGQYGQLFRKYLNENIQKVNRLLMEGRYRTFLEETGKHLDEMADQLRGQMKQCSPEPEGYLERTIWLNQIDMTVRELVMQEMNSYLSTQD